MGIFEWVMAGSGLLITIVSVICSVALPLLILGGLGYFLYKRNQQSMAYRQSTQTWQSTTGTVVMSSVQRKHTGKSYSHYPVVVYMYQVNGQQYQSQRIKAGEQFLNVRLSGQAEATVQKYPIGSMVTVYYNPSNPAESVLER
jgi:hypothetical protein